MAISKSTDNIALKGRLYRNTQTGNHFFCLGRAEDFDTGNMNVIFCEISTGKMYVRQERHWMQQVDGKPIHVPKIPE